TRKGTTTSKARAGVASNSTQPTVVPTTAVGMSASSRRVRGRSARLPTTLATYPGKTATLLVTLAGTAPSPVASRAGNVISEPPPAIALTVPAASPATTRRAALGRSMSGHLYHVCDGRVDWAVASASAHVGAAEGRPGSTGQGGC